MTSLIFSLFCRLPKTGKLIGALGAKVSPLIVAAHKGQADAIHSLLAAGADATAKSSYVYFHTCAVVVDCLLLRSC